MLNPPLDKNNTRDRRLSRFTIAPRAEVLCAVSTWKTARAIAKIYRCAELTVSRRLKREGVELRRNSGRISCSTLPMASDDEVRAVYQRVKTTKAVAHEFRCQAGAAGKRLRAMGIDPRKNCRNKWQKHAIILNEESDDNVRAAYRCVRTATAVGLIYGVSYNTANRRLAGLGIVLKGNRFRKRTRNVEKVLSFMRRDGLSPSEAVRRCLQEQAAAEARR